MMKIFHRLKAVGEFRRRHMPFLKTIEDLEILRDIGFHQEAGDPITLKLLFLREIGSVATVQRRLSRLKRLGVVHQSRAAHDKRLVKLTVNPAVLRDYKRMFALLGKRDGRADSAPRSTGRARQRKRT
jgi:hypothetical protein